MSTRTAINPWGDYFVANTTRTAINPWGDYFVYTEAPPSAPPPTLSSGTPNNGYDGSVQPIALVGSGFAVSGFDIAISGTGVSLTNKVASDDNNATANVVIASGSAYAGVKNITVTNANGTSDPLAFTVRDRNASGGTNRPRLTRVYN